nr:immunoglobulin light chain junction region [Macaca mulatta]MOW00759.1 immunoglobulin light chain junction region [Macaca mulatta]MOW00800.1 immunoglobulin light chain junction region [Macaca mulatta]
NYYCQVWDSSTDVLF